MTPAELKDKIMALAGLSTRGEAAVRVAAQRQEQDVQEEAEQAALQDWAADPVAQDIYLPRLEARLRAAETALAAASESHGKMALSAGMALAYRQMRDEIRALAAASGRMKDDA